MKTKETATTFHQRLLRDKSEPGQFTVYRTEDYSGRMSLPHTRRDFYKISLLSKGEGVLSFGDKTYDIKDNIILFLNPMIPYSWEPVSAHRSGYSCLFTEDFIAGHLNTESLSKSPLFKASGNHVLIADTKSVQFLTGIFEQMMIEMNSDYVHKHELLRSYVQIIIHEALKIEPLESKPFGNSSTRLSDLFLDLLEKQFPIVSPRHTLQSKNANEFSARLAVHTNHLNRVLKETTGSTTTELISARIAREAKALLLHSDWDIAEIGYCLGFEHPSNFNIFFKKRTGFTPNHFRRNEVATH